jgi:glycogen(starch) synthase
MRHTDCISSSSRAMARFCADKYGCEMDRIRVVHSGVDTSRFVPRPQPVDIRFPRILFVGNIVGNKGIANLVELVLKLRRRYPRICLKAVGKTESDLASSLLSTIEIAGAHANVEFVGYVEHTELASFYAWCDFLAVPSVYEALGNIYLEAMASGRPVVACNTGGTPEAVIDGRTGILVPPRDVEALEAAIIRLTDDTALRERMGGDGREWVEQNFSFLRYTDKVEKLYKDLVGS